MPPSPTGFCAEPADPPIALTGVSMSQNVPMQAHEHTEHAQHAAHSGDPFISRIAISVAAEMIAVRRNPKSNWRSLSMSVFAGESARALLK